MKADYIYDLYRFTGRTDSKTFVQTLLFNKFYRRVFYYRMLSKRKSILVKVLNFILTSKTSIEIPTTVTLGKGVLFLHPYGITFNSKVIAGENLTIMKGVTIGNSKTGKVGVPIIGNNVYVGLNSTIVGGVHIGNDVMIAPNTFVNFDVPDGSLVLGSPGVIHKKDKASSAYLINSISDLAE